MSIYRCKACGCFHGWTRHPCVAPVTRHVRYPAEDVWWCPGCGQEHRTTDGTLFGQSWKAWEEVSEEALEETLHPDLLAYYRWCAHEEKMP